MQAHAVNRIAGSKSIVMIKRILRMNNRKRQFRKIMRSGEGKLLNLQYNEKKLGRVLWQIAEADGALLKARFIEIDNKKRRGLN